MDLLQFNDWLSSTAFSQAIQLRLWAIPTIQTVHIVALSVLFAAALMVALRICGRGLAAEPLTSIARRFTRLIWMLLVILLLSGILLIVAEPHRTLSNPVFYAKMLMLLLVVAITLWLAAVSRPERERVTAVHRVAAVFTLLLWMGIMFAGRFIAYYEAY